ncbi:DUF433 domain-containing protein [Rugamonas sp. FT82W]|uniref:DUF433 domain-containing protein n=1 Tax=Duganella vulcania TaxID=2692166 RepID=A0A845FYL6_9BURK|nr:DUF433 domain-containing protein [Duganella vulcania]MYM85829.1 DUF433 domain-containing protein [Duganella vulcania]
MGQQVIHRDPEIYSGATVFVGTRVPLSVLFDYLKAGESIQCFLADYPSVSKSAAIVALEIAEQCADRWCHSYSVRWRTCLPAH